MKRESTSVAGFLQSAADWLIIHHEAKLEGRRSLVANLGLRPGQKVLEIASGPGLFTGMFAAAVGNDGHVLAFDIDAALVEAGARLGIKNAEFVVADFHDQHWMEKLAKQDFDVAIMFNCLVYDPDYNRVISNFANNLRSDARLVIKDSDFDHIFTNICDMRLFREVLYANRTRRDLPLDNFLGGKLFGKSDFDGARVTSRYVWPYLMQSPFSDAQIRYIRENISILLTNAEGKIARAAADEVGTAFDEKRLRDANVEDALFFLMHDFLLEVAGNRP